MAWCIGGEIYADPVFATRSGDVFFREYDKRIGSEKLRYDGSVSSIGNSLLPGSIDHENRSASREVMTDVP